MISDLLQVILFGCISFFVLRFAKKRGFFSVDESSLWKNQVGFFHVLIGFIIYFAVAFLLTPFVGRVLAGLLRKEDPDLQFLFFASWLNFFTASAALVLLYLFLFKEKQRGKCILWQQNSEASFLLDLKTAGLTWLLAFPIIIFISNLIEWIFSHLLKMQTFPEQLAVYFLKMTFHDPFYFLLASFTIIILAPLLEETLFRGLLQSFIRNHLGIKRAIFITSLCFAFFHYSPQQGVSNLPIIASLFILALLLGLIYEKRRSLWAPICLHAGFNAMSVMNLYFIG